MKVGNARLAAVSLCPVKSTAVRDVASAQVGRFGLVGDREWMVVDRGGDEVTARELPALLGVVATNPAAGGADRVALRLEAPGVGAVELDRPTAGERAVRLFGQDLRARPAGAHADRWLREAVGRDDVSLVWCSAPDERAVELGAGVSDRAAFQDRSPVSLLSAASVDQVNEWTGSPEPLPASRFRANLLVAGVPPFAEDGWGTVRIGDAELRVAGPISRCVLTTIDPLTMRRGKEPIRTLARHRRWDGKTWLAVHLRVVRPGAVSVGDVVEFAGHRAATSDD